MSRRKAAEDAIAKLWNVDPAASEDEDISIDDNCEPQVSDEDEPAECSDDSSSENEEEINHHLIFDEVSDKYSSISSLRPRSGTVWKPVTTNCCASQAG